MILSSAFDPVNDPGKPRASGDDPDYPWVSQGIISVNPARAGMILTGSPSATLLKGKPRASGDDPLNARDMVLLNP